MSIKELAIALVEETNCNKKEIQKAIKELERQALKIVEESKDPYNVSNIQNLLDRIFELCPECNFIPLAYECQYGTSVETSKNFYDLEDVCDNYLDLENYYYPQVNDEMKVKEWNEILNCWMEAVHKCNIQEGTETDCDYCSMTHYSIYGYLKETQKVEYLGDID